MARVRRNFITGTLGASLATGATSITFTAAPQLPNITAPDSAALIINPTPYGTVSSGSEIVYLTAYAGGTGGTVTRAQEGTSSPVTWVSGTPYALGVLSSDFTLTSGMNNGDFPTPTASGQLFVSTASGFSNPSWTKTVSGITITGSSVYGSTIYSGNTFNAGSVPGSAVTGALSSSTTISGSQVAYSGGGVAPNQIWSVTSTASVAISGFTNYVALVNGYGQATVSNFISSKLNRSTVTGMTSPTLIAEAIGQSAIGAVNAFVSVSDSAIITLAPSTVFYAKVTNSGYTSGAGSAIIFGVN